MNGLRTGRSVALRKLRQRREQGSSVAFGLVNPRPVRHTTPRLLPGAMRQAWLGTWPIKPTNPHHSTGAHVALAATSGFWLCSCCCCQALPGAGCA